MKILHCVELYYPSKGGMQEVVRQISERLAEAGHEVTVATTKLPERDFDAFNGVRIEEFDISGNLVRGMEGETDKYREFILSSGFDVVSNFAAQQWTVDLTMDIIESIKAKKVFVPTGFSGLYLPEYRKYFEMMKGYMKKNDMNVFLSNDYRDINFARENNVGNIMLIPNGASEKEFLEKSYPDIRKKLGIPKDAFLVLHVGSHTTVKGHKEAIEIFNAAKIGNSVFLMVGNDAVRACAYSCKAKALASNIRNFFLNNKTKIIVSSLERKETVAAYRQADLFLFASNIECSPIVLFECMASKTPFLTTDVGNASEIIDWSGGGKLLPTQKGEGGYSFARIDKSAEMLQELYLEKNKREAMANKAFGIWKKKFTWERIASKYEELYLSLLN